MSMAKRFTVPPKRTSEVFRLRLPLHEWISHWGRRELRSRLFSALAVGVFLTGCTLPYPGYSHLISIQWGIILPVPEGATLVREKNTAYLLSNQRDWTLRLSVWRPSRKERGQLPLEEKDLRRILDKGKKLVGQEPGIRWLGGRVSRLGGAIGVQLDFEGLPEKGQASIYFQKGDILFHRVAVFGNNNRLYSLHLQSNRLQKGEALRFWSDMKVDTRLSGKTLLSIFRSEKFPESDHFSIIRETIGGAGNS